MAKRAKKRSGGLRFFLGMLVYAFVFMAAVMVGMRVLWDFLEDYEATRPEHVIEAYQRDFDAQALRAGADSYLNSLNKDVNTPDGYFAYIENELRNNVVCRKRGDISTDNQYVYTVFMNDRAVGEVTTRAVGKSKYGFSTWEVADQSFDFSYLTTETSITIPSYYSLRCNGNPIGQEYITNDSIRFELLSEFYGGDISLPTMCTYTITNYIGEAELEVLDHNGNVVANGDMDINEDVLTDNCSDEDKAAIDQFLQGYINALIRFSSNAGEDRYGNYYALARYIVDGTTLEKRMYEAIDGLYWVHGRNNSLQEMTVHNYMDLGGGYYMVKLTYDVNTLGLEGYVVTNNHIKLILTNASGTLLAQTQTTYA